MLVDSLGLFITVKQLISNTVCVFQGGCGSAAGGARS